MNYVAPLVFLWLDKVKPKAYRNAIGFLRRLLLLGALLLFAHPLSALAQTYEGETPLDVARGVADENGDIVKFRSLTIRWRFAGLMGEPLRQFAGRYEHHTPPWVELADTPVCFAEHVVASFRPKKVEPDMVKEGALDGVQLYSRTRFRMIIQPNSRVAFAGGPARTIQHYFGVDSFSQGADYGPSVPGSPEWDRLFQVGPVGSEDISWLSEAQARELFRVGFTVSRIDMVEPQYALTLVKASYKRHFRAKPCGDRPVEPLAKEEADDEDAPPEQAASAKDAPPDQTEPQTAADRLDAMLNRVASAREEERHAALLELPDNGRTQGSVAETGEISTPSSANTVPPDFRNKINTITHNVGVFSLAYSPDGRQILTGNADQTARIWNVETGAEVRRFQGDKNKRSHNIAVSAVAFAQDGRHIFTADPDQMVRMWDAVSGQEVRRFRGHSRGVTSLVLSPDGATLLSASYDSTIRLWDIQNGREIQRFIGHSGPDPEGFVSSVAFSPDGSRIVSGGHDGTVRVWNTIDGKETQRFEGRSRYTNPATFSPDGRYLAIGGNNNLRLLDLSSGQVVREFRSELVHSVSFTPNGEFLLFGTHGRHPSLNFVDLGNTDRHRSYRIGQHNGTTNRGVTFAFSPDASHVASVARGDNTVILWGR